MEKGMKIAKVINKILGVFFWIGVACGIVTLAVGLFILLAKESDFRVSGNFSVTLGSCKVFLSDWTAKQYRVVGAIGCLGTVVLMPFVCWSIRVLQRIFRPVGEGTPFNGEMSPALRRLAWVELIGGAVRAAAEAASEWIIGRAVDVQSLFDVSKASRVEWNGRIDGTFLVAFVILLLMSFVFQYGEKLQRQDDELL